MSTTEERKDAFSSLIQHMVTKDKTLQLDPLYKAVSAALEVDIRDEDVEIPDLCSTHLSLK